MNTHVVRGLLLSTILVPSGIVVQPALAQEAPPAEAGAQADAPQQGEDAIVVTGLRRSLQAARDIKRDALQFVDAIVADDIGKLPDRNVAESLARVSGIQVDRGIAEGTSVSVRGLRQNVYLFNGREIQDSTGRGGVGLDQLGSSTYGILALVPSELISRLEVTKLAGADQIAGALGGIIDIQTRMPLGEPEQIALRGALTYDDLSEQAGFEVFGLVSQRFADDTLGVLLSASYGRRDLSQQGLDTFSGYLRFNDNTVTPPQVRFGNSDARAQDIQEEREKLGLNAVVQWRPSDRVEIIADTFYSRLNSNRDRYWLSFTPTAGLTNATYSENNVLLSGRATTAVLTNTEFADVDADLWSSALRGRFDVADNVRATAEVSYGRSTSTYRQLYFRLQPIASITPTVDFDFTQGDFGAYAINGVDLSDPAQLRFTILFDNTYHAVTDATAARTDWSVDLGQGFLRSFNLGGRLSWLDSTQDPERADIRPAGGIPATQLADFITLHSNPDFARGEFGGLPRSFLAASAAFTGCDAFTAFPVISQDQQCLNPTQNTGAFASTFEIEERFVEGYARLDYETEIGGSVNLAGNIGLRYIDRRLTSAGNQISPTGAPTPTTFRRSDGEWLPSAVARIEIANDFIIRAGAARVVAFPNTADLNNGLTLFNNAVFVDGVQVSPGTGNGGAPDLDPFKANQFDASFEYYFAPQALASVGLFYKDVSSFIVQQQSAETYAGVNYLIARKVNGEEATVKGVEALVQLPFSFLPAPLDGLGVVATYSYIDSSTPIRDVAGRVLPFPGLSRNNINLVGYYEKGPLSLRVAYNWRDQYLVGLSAAATGIYNDSYQDLSATFRYDFTERLSLTLEASNLLNERQRTYDGTPEALRTNVFFGRIFKASVSMRF
jgi:iron complex outermembrane receptor protein